MRVRLTFWRSAVNAERTRDRNTAARSRGRSPRLLAAQPTFERPAQAFSRCNDLLDSRLCSASLRRILPQNIGLVPGCPPAKDDDDQQDTAEDEQEPGRIDPRASQHLHDRAAGAHT